MSRICFIPSMNSVWDHIKVLLGISAYYIVWVCLHYAATHLYVRFCTPSDWYGFIMSPFMAMTPHCRGLGWLIYTGSNVIQHMWVILGVWFASKLLHS